MNAFSKNLMVVIKAQRCGQMDNVITTGLSHFYEGVQIMYDS